MTDLLALADLVEKLTGPDRDLEAEIWLACTPGATRNKWSYVHKATGRECTVDETRDATNRLIIVPEYTTSIDASLTLLPEGWLWSAGVCRRENHASVGSEIGTVEGELIFETFGATAPLALLAAILRARQAVQSGQAQTEARE